MINIDKTLYTTSPQVKGTVLTAEYLASYFPVKFEEKNFVNSKTGGVVTTPILVCETYEVKVPVGRKNANGKYVNGAAVKGNRIEVELPLRYFNMAVAQTDAYTQAVDPLAKLQVVENTSTTFTGIRQIIANSNKQLKQFRENAMMILGRLGITSANIYKDYTEESQAYAQAYNEFLPSLELMKQSFSLAALIRTGQLPTSTTISHSVNDQGYDVYKLNI